MSADIEALAARLQRLEDIEEIRALFLRYADCSTRTTSRSTRTCSPRTAS